MVLHAEDQNSHYMPKKASNAMFAASAIPNSLDVQIDKLASSLHMVI